MIILSLKNLFQQFQGCVEMSVRHYQDYFDGAVIVRETQQGANVHIRYPETKMAVANNHHQQRMQRKWEVFPGRNSFYCNGRIVMAKKAGIFYLTVVLIVVTSALFFAFDCPDLVEISPLIPAVGTYTTIQYYAAKV